MNHYSTITRVLFLLTFVVNCSLFGQQKPIIHSHNDYLQSVPFWNAFSNGATSFEADVFLKDKQLFVAHTLSEIQPKNTFETLYAKPLKTVLNLKYQEDKKLILLIDIKSEAVSTLNKVISVLEKYPSIHNSNNLKIVISGNRPPSNTYNTYPSYIYFDCQELDTEVSKKAWDKIGMVSLSFKPFSTWNGKGRLTHDDATKVKNIIAKAKKTKKPFRFWASPDSKRAWRTLADMGVDIINTDKPFLCATYFNTLPNRAITSTTFSKVYQPSYSADQKDLPVKNIILLIGDGNGLAQISATTLANNGNLSLTQLKSIGFIKTQAADDFTTDSAAAGTALATGIKTNNRAIGTDPFRKPIQNITEILSSFNFSTACITTDNIIGATPASFYAHAIDRSDDAIISKHLINSKLNLFIGGGGANFKNTSLTTNFTILPSLENLENTTADKVGVFTSAHGLKTIINGRGNLLANATKKGLDFLHKKNKPFFLMIEAAKIDHAGHANDTAGILAESIDFDKAITEALKFADTHPDTLVIITADHETSGFSIPQGNVKTHEIEGYFASYDHTAIMVPIFAYGPMSYEFQGVYENNEVFHKIMKILKK
ncbi:alkaline phosphatase [uncultured Polaribacter sp.]|uniref:alkaline phosphatase n=1 Tax=uncultured Polaribacter sp. TaxID=174711 RepID=UPI00261ACAE3|nr:alkaline phosphatase [uncultured Polaribacter sp.]